MAVGPAVGPDPGPDPVLAHGPADVTADSADVTAETGRTARADSNADGPAGGPAGGPDRVMYKVIPCRGNGNCFFEAASRATYADEGMDHQQLRQAACQWMVQNQRLVEVFFTSEQRAAESALQRAVRMTKPGEYADQSEVMAVAHLTGRSFLIYDLSRDTLLRLGQEHHDGRGPIVLRLSNSQDETAAHYDLLVPMADEETLVAPKHVSSPPLRAGALPFVPTAEAPPEDLSGVSGAYQSTAETIELPRRHPPANESSGRGGRGRDGSGHQEPQRHGPRERQAQQRREQQQTGSQQRRANPIAPLHGNPFAALAEQEASTEEDLEPEAGMMPPSSEPQAERLLPSSKPQAGMPAKPPSSNPGMLPPSKPEAGMMPPS